MTKEELDKVTMDIMIYGNAFIHHTVNGARRIDPRELLKEAEEFCKLLVLPEEDDEHSRSKA